MAAPLPPAGPTTGPSPAGSVSPVSGPTADTRHLSPAMQGLLSVTGDVYFRADQDGALLEISQSVEHLLGYRPQDLIGRPIADVYARPDGREAFLETLRDNGGLLRDHPIHLRHATGALVWISTSCRLLCDADGHESGVEGLVRDITPRREAELKAVRQSNLIAALLDASRDAIMLIARDGTLLAANRVFMDRFGLNPDRTSGLNLYDLFPPAVATRRRAAVEGVLDSGQALHTRDVRDTFVLDNSIYPVVGPDGRPEMVAVFSSDITEQVRAEEQNRRYIREIEQSNEDLAQFAYVASHDLREPLRTLISYSTLLEYRLGSTLEGEPQEFLGYIRTAARRMNALIEDLLAYSRADRDDAPPQWLDTGVIVQAVATDLEALIEENGGQLTVETPLPPVVAPPAPIRRLFQNLITNALKYGKPGIAPVVRVGYRAETGQFYVQDNGIGIARDHHERIFQIFQRLDGAHGSDGTGIGLAVCKKIVERLHGEISVASSPENGATFLFTLPLQEDRPLPLSSPPEESDQGD